MAMQGITARVGLGGPQGVLAGPGHPNRNRVFWLVAAALAIAILASAMTALSVRSGLWTWPRGDVTGTSANVNSGGNVTAASDRAVAVLGEARVPIQPDIAYTQLGVSLHRDTVANAIRDASAQMTKLNNAVKQAGVAAADIQTNGFGVYVYAPYGNPQGYTAYNSVHVTVRDLTKVNAIIEGAVKAAGDDITLSGFTFDVGDKTAAVASGRVQAIAAAKAQAQHWAQLAGKSLGDVQRIEEPTTQAVYQPQGVGGSGGAGIPVETGQGYIVVRVGVTYGLK